MRDLLELTIASLTVFGNRFAHDAMPSLAAEARDLAVDLRKLAKTAELRDELWAAARVWGSGKIDIIEATEVLATVCRKVADTDGK